MKIFEILSNHSDYVKPTLVSHPLLISNEAVGVEIELEGVSGRMRSHYWVEKSDGSLRNFGREFVFRGPLGGIDLFRALVEAGKHFNDINPSPSWRCSTHVHLDVRDLDVRELKNLILLYTIYEEVLFKYSGYNRYNNNFCPAFGFAQQQIQVLSTNWYLPDHRFLEKVFNEWSKYSSLNLLPIRSFGSVEFRIANAITTTGEMIKLCNRFLILKKCAVEWTGSYGDLISHYSSLPIEDVFNNNITGIRGEDIDQSQIQKGAFLANDILYLSTKSRENLRTDGLIRTNLTMPRLGTLRNIAEPSKDVCEEAGEMYLWISEILERGTIPAITQDRCDKIVNFFGVPLSWVVHEESHQAVGL